MATRPTMRVLAFSTIAVAAVLTAFMAQNTTQAQEEASGIIVGTYEPQRVAEQYGINEKLMEGMTGLQQRMQAAQQTGDQQEMQQIQAEAQQVQNDVIGEFEKEVEAVLPSVAEETGADIIAVQVAYVAEGIETKDVTNEVIAEMNGGAAQEADEQPETLQSQ